MLAQGNGHRSTEGAGDVPPCDLTLVLEAAFRFVLR